MSTNESPEIHSDPQLVPDPAATEGDVVEASDSGPNRRDIRAEIGKYVSLVDFPTTGRQLVEAAQMNHAPAPVIDRLRRLGPDSRFENARAVWTELNLEATNRY